MKVIYNKHPLTEDQLDQAYEIDLPEIDLADKEIAIFTIGPVQSFISAAKKIKEFWAGSYLLSYLTWQAIEHIINEVGKDSIIFPMVEEQPFYKRFIKEKKEVSDLEMPTLPNRFMAILDEDMAERILKECENKVSKKLFEILQSPVINFNLTQKDNAKLKEQINELLEIYWISIPASENTDIVKQKYQTIKGVDVEVDNAYSFLTSLAEELLGSRKNLRNFNFVEEKGKKCFICGERSALIEIKYEDDNRKICGVCALKRNFEKYFNQVISPAEQIYYPAIIEIATMDYKEDLAKNLAKDNKLDELLDAFKAEGVKDYKSKLLARWEGRAAKEKEFLQIEGDYFDLDGEKIKEHRKIKAKLSSFNSEYGLSLNKYYALIYLDGDSMGKWVSGELIDKDMTPELHSLVSKALTNYSLQFVKDIVEKNGRRGKVIYAGGDDVVAFVNLEDLFTVMRDLTAYFSGSLNDGDVDLLAKNGIVNFAGKDILTLGSKASISLGACIAHYKEPLSLVIKKAQQMESKAKDNKVKIAGTEKQKDAFALGLIKNSGEIRETEVKWVYDDKDLIQEAIKPLLEIIKDNKLSRSFAYILKEELSLINAQQKESDLTAEIIKSEMKRLADRKSIDLNNEERDRLKEILNILRLVYNKKNLTQGVNNLDNFISLLEIIFFIGKRGE